MGPTGAAERTLRRGLTLETDDGNLITMMFVITSGVMNCPCTQRANKPRLMIPAKNPGWSILGRGMNDGYGADTGPSRGDPIRPAFRPIEASKVAICNGRFTSIPAGGNAQKAAGRRRKADPPGRNPSRVRLGRSIPPSFERKRSVEQPRLFKLFECERIGDAHGVSARRIGAKAGVIPHRRNHLGGFCRPALPRRRPQR